MKNILKTSYSYNRDYKNPITYHIQTDTVTTSLNYKDALEIAYAVIDSLGGSYDFLEELKEEFENKGIEIEVIEEGIWQKKAIMKI